MYNKKSDRILSEKYPEIVEKWVRPVDEDKNWLNPQNCTVGSGEKIWWRCGNEECERVFQRCVSKMVDPRRSRLCPTCSRIESARKRRKRCVAENGSLEEKFPELANEWIKAVDHEDCTPADVTINSGYKVLWKCKKCLYEWTAIISNRTKNKSNCPRCAGKVATVGINDLQTWCIEHNRFDILVDWDYKMNHPLTPLNVCKSSGKIVTWICHNKIHGEKGYCYERSVHYRTSGKNCPKCGKMMIYSVVQMALFYFIKKYFQNVICEYTEERLGKRSLDIYLPQAGIAVEYDGGYSHKDVDSDIEKDEICKNLGICLIRVREKGCPQYHSEDVIFVRRKTASFDKDFEESVKEVITIIGEMTGNIIHNAQVDIKKELAAILKLRMKVQLTKNIFVGRKLVSTDRSLLVCAPDIAELLDKDKNGGLSAQNISRHSNQIVCWSHWHEGTQTRHEWWDSPNGMKAATCPICSNHILLKGFNDLATTRPDLAMEWDYEKNEGTPAEILNGAAKKIWWICSEGHRWQATANSRVSRSTGCPVCAKKRSCHAVVRIEDGKTYSSLKEAAQDVGVKYNTISAALGYSNRTAGGYHWKYLKIDENIGTACSVMP